MQAKAAFMRGDSINRLTALLGVTRTVWERALRQRLGDAAFEEQLAKNLAANRGGGRPKAGQISAPELRPDIRRQMDHFRARDLAKERERRQQQQGEDQRAAEAKALRLRRIAKRLSGGPIPVVCINTGEAYPSLTAAAAATGVEVFRVRRSLVHGIGVPGADGQLGFRRWQDGDPVVALPQDRKPIPLRFEDGSCWPSGRALIEKMGATRAEGARFYRRLKKLGYGPGSPPLALRELLILANWLPHLERQRLAQRIAKTELDKAQP
ncbi:hypothetical protein KBY83_05960 [Cyanobium sp. WKJ7-Wakatipu]|nr:hypothetical protein [Cyanobium sp. WKJ7-Wakatipu]